MPKITYSQSYQDVSEKLRQQRKLAGLTQEELAMKAQLDYKTIQRLESVQVKPSIDTFFQLAQALGVTPNDLTPDSFISNPESKKFQDLCRRFNQLTEENQLIFLSSANAMLDGFFVQQGILAS